LIGASYKGKLPHFEINLKLWFICIPISAYLKKTTFLTLFSDFFSFLTQKTHFRKEAGRDENKEKWLFYFGFRIFFASPNSDVRYWKSKNRPPPTPLILVAQRASFAAKSILQTVRVVESGFSATCQKVFLTQNININFRVCN
jgi:hypothetical protein